MSDSKKDNQDYEFEIENVVATVSVSIPEKMDLNSIVRKYPDIEYNPERFPGIIIRFEKPKATVLMFSTGRMVITGMRTDDVVEEVVQVVIKRIRKVGIDISNPQIEIQNIVASGDLHKNIDLNYAAVVMETAMYEPEVFPGLIYRMHEPRAVFLIFSTGRIVCTGAKNKEIVAEAVKKLAEEVNKLGIAQEKKEEESEFNESDEDLEDNLEFI